MRVYLSFIENQWVALGWNWQQGRVVVSLTYTPYLSSLYEYLRLVSVFLACQHALESYGALLNIPRLKWLIVNDSRSEFRKADNVYASGCIFEWKKAILILMLAYLKSILDRAIRRMGFVSQLRYKCVMFPIMESCWYSADHIRLVLLVHYGYITLYKPDKLIRNYDHSDT